MARSRCLYWVAGRGSDNARLHGDGRCTACNAAPQCPAQAAAGQQGHGHGGWPQGRCGCCPRSHPS
eukprot:892329-Alexandrium_andersonii.AAC.1